MKNTEKRLKFSFGDDYREFNPYDIKKLYDDFHIKLLFGLITAMIVYALKSDIYWTIMVSGFVMFMLQDRQYSYLMLSHLNPYYGEGKYYIIPEFVLRGLSVGAIITALTHFSGYSNVWVAVCGVGGYCTGYAMNFGVNMSKYNEVLRGLGVAMIVGAICVNVGVALVPLIFFTLGSFLVAYHFWISL